MFKIVFLKIFWPQKHENEFVIPLQFLSMHTA